jgi:uncharacterized OB-fold protein
VAAAEVALVVAGAGPTPNSSMMLRVWVRRPVPYLPPDLPLPTIDRSNRGFWLAASQGRLDIQPCAICGWHRHPPTEGCYHCGSLDWGWDTLPGTGYVFTYTWVHHAVHPSLAGVVPYNIAIVEVYGTVGEPVRLISNVLDVTEAELVIGARVTVVYETIAPDIGVARCRLDPR